MKQFNKIVILFILLLIAIQVDAQRFSWGVPVKHDPLEFSGKATIKRYLLQENESGLIRLRVQKNDIIANESVILEKFDANFELQKTVDVITGSMTSNYLEEVIVAKDKFYVFFTVMGLDKTNTLKVQGYDFEGEPIGDEKTLDVITDTKAIARGEYFIAASANRNHFTTVAIPIYEKKTNETITVKTFDAGFKEVFGKAITLDIPRDRFVYDTPYIMNDGTMFLYKHQKVKKVGVVSTMYVLDKAKRALMPTEMKLSNGKDFVLLDNTMLENSKGNFVYAGLHKDEGSFKAPLGVFYLEFDKTGNIVREVVKEFRDTPKLGFTGLAIKEIQLLENDELLFLAHQLSENSVAQGNDVNNRVYAYQGQSIFVARLNQDELIWSQIIDRQVIETKEDRGRLLDFDWLYDAEGDNLIVLYNDLQARYDNTLRAGNYKIPMLAYIAKDGKYSTKPLLNVGLGKYDDSYTFCTDEFYQIKNYLIVKCSNNIDFKIGRFSL
jgi:hypothetical protein